jgi:hypothetical protein
VFICFSLVFNCLSDNWIEDCDLKLTRYGWRDWLSQGFLKIDGGFLNCLRSVKHLAKVDQGKTQAWFEKLDG